MTMVRMELDIEKQVRPKNTMITMKMSPIRWRRRKRGGGKGDGSVKSDDSDVVDDRCEFPKDDSDSTSCDATDLLSAMSTVAGDRTSVDAPGWVHNAVDQRSVKLHIKSAPKPSILTDRSDLARFPSDSTSTASRESRSFERSRSDSTSNSAQTAATHIQSLHTAWPNRPLPPGSTSDASIGSRSIGRSRNVNTFNSVRTAAPQGLSSHNASLKWPLESTSNGSMGSHSILKSGSVINSASAQKVTSQILGSDRASQKWSSDSTSNTSRGYLSKGTGDENIDPNLRVQWSQGEFANTASRYSEVTSNTSADYLSKGTGVENDDPNSTRTATPQTMRGRWPPGEPASTVSRCLASDAPRAEAKGSVYKAISSTSSSTSHHQRADVSHVGQRPTEMENRSSIPVKETIQRERSFSETSAEDDDLFESIVSCSGSSSMPPPNFKLPRKEIRDAIKYHLKLGRALSKLALDTEINDEKSDVLRSVPSNDSTIMSALDSSRLIGLQFASSACRLGASNVGSSYEPDADGSTVQPLMNLASKKWAANFDNSNLDNGLERVSSMESDTSSMEYSNKSNYCKLERHLTFLQSHMTQSMRSPTVPRANTEEFSYDAAVASDDISKTPLPSHDIFFPIAGDLRSPPTSTCSSHVDQDEAAPYNSKLFSSGSATKKLNTLTPMCMASPPRTPLVALNIDGRIGSGDRVECASCSPEVYWSDDDTVEQEDLDDVLNGVDFLDGLNRIKDETASMMLEIKDRIRSDIKQTMDEEMEQHRSRLKSVVSEMSKRLENAVQNEVNNVTKEKGCSILSPSSKVSSSFKQKQSQFSSSPHNATTSPAFSKETPRNAAPENSIDSGAILRGLEKSFLSMEASIMDKITAQMDKDALQQRQAIEQIIEEKVSKVIAGSGLELKLAVQEVMQETQRVSRIALRDRTPPPPARTPPRTGSVKKSSFISSGWNTPSPRSDSKTSSISAKSRRRGSSSSAKKRVGASPDKKWLEASFADTMRVIDDFVDDCDDIANDFDKIVNRMQDSDLPSDLDCDPDEFEFMGFGS